MSSAGNFVVVDWCCQSFPLLHGYVIQEKNTFQQHNFNLQKGGGMTLNTLLNEFLYYDTCLVTGEIRITKKNLILNYSSINDNYHMSNQQQEK